ncbi:porin [Pseudoduganella aquatica]|uniref:Porin n=1 Tax=Pseudoduganella aquatica TaxID=2660641 RepID=A0A7X4KRB1_9BURK|nr:porin [Pseudoduganella aquatica]MYN11201.1 porin [Pseudoduganella aquatica]
MIKPTLLALALAAVLPHAAARSSVQFYGAIDAGLRYQTNVDEAGNSLLSMGSGNYYSNRLGFRALEDLGGGLSARVLLESGFVSKTGALDNTKNVLFNRTAAVGLGGKWGYVDLGRQYTIGFRTELFLDPFNHHYTGLVPLSSGAGTTLPAAAVAAGLSASSSSGTRFNNDIQYSGTFGGLTVRAEYAPGEVEGDARKGTARAAGFSYTGGTLLAAGAYTRKQTPAGFENEAHIVGGGAKLQNVTVKAGLSRERQDGAAGVAYRNMTAFGGVSYLINPFVEITGALYRSRYAAGNNSGTRTLSLLGASYTLSTRTNLYAEIDVNSYRGALLPASKQTRQHGVSAGVMHRF